MPHNPKLCNPKLWKKHKNPGVCRPLRDVIATMRETGGTPSVEELEAVADAIDREHRYRMERSRDDTRRAFAKYLRGVIADYLKGRKRLHSDADARYARKAVANGLIGNDD
jgi:hypothetical protein